MRHTTTTSGKTTNEDRSAKDVSDDADSKAADSDGALALRSASTIADRVRERPWMYAGVAMGCGFVLGGGLATPLAMRLLRRGMSAALQLTIAPMVLSRLEEVAGRAFGVGDEQPSAKKRQ